MAGAARRTADRNKDEAMAARLKAEGVERETGRCAICYALIRNGSATYNHYLAHSHGADAK